MPAVVVIGAQWGDEGKGKAVDVFSEKADFVVRYQGGANAGHTLRLKDQQIILHLVPSGILHPSVRCVISAGVALDIETLCQEIKALKKSGFLSNTKQLSISDSATLVLAIHKKLDQARERKAKKNEKNRHHGKRHQSGLRKPHITKRAGILRSFPKKRKS